MDKDEVIHGLPPRLEYQSKYQYVMALLGLAQQMTFGYAKTYDHIAMARFHAVEELGEGYDTE